MENFSFGSTSGSAFAFYFFLLLALFIGFAIYRLLQEPRLKKMLRPSMPRWQGLAIGAGVVRGRGAFDSLGAGLRACGSNHRSAGRGYLARGLG